MTKLIIAIALTLSSLFASAQLKGSGVTITKNYDYNNFTKIDFNDLDGNLEIEVGKPYSIAITIDDNLLNLLTVDQKDNLLSIALKGNTNNRMYIEDTKIKIKITTPLLTEVRNNGNSSLQVMGINSENFKTTNPDNGSTTLSGKVNNLQVVCRGNGNLYAEKLIAQKATVKCSGNGNVKINVMELVTAGASGNGNIINIGKARFDAASTASGNSSLNGRKNN
jgi:Putative auto-transporter adhesin, head GIN domain